MAFTGSWYKILSTYSPQGILVEVTSHPPAQMLSKTDVDYLLVTVDGTATNGTGNNVNFTWNGAQIAVTEEQWVEFHEALLSVVAHGGWTHV